MKFSWNMERLLIALLFSCCLTPSKGATHECHGHHHCTSVQCPSLTSVCVHGECRCSQYGVGLTCRNYHHAVNTYDPSCVEAGMNCTEGLSPSCHGGYCSCTHDTYRCNVVNDCIHGEQDFHLGECVDIGGVHGFWFCSAEHHCICVFYSHTNSSLIG